MSDINKRLARVYEIFNEEGFDLLGGLYEITKDLECALDIIDLVDWFNFYTDIPDYSSLAYTLIDDSVLWEGVDTDMDLFYSGLSSYKDDEEKITQYLKENGWFVAPSGLAIGLSDELRCKYDL